MKTNKKWISAFAVCAVTAAGSMLALNSTEVKAADYGTIMAAHYIGDNCPDYRHSYHHTYGADIASGTQSIVHEFHQNGVNCINEHHTRYTQNQEALKQSAQNQSVQKQETQNNTVQNTVSQSPTQTQTVQNQNGYGIHHDETYNGVHHNADCPQNCDGIHHDTGRHHGEGRHHR